MLRSESLRSESQCLQLFRWLPAHQNLLDFCRYASTCQTVGMNIGYFTSFTVFLALNDVDFCNKYLRSGDHQPQGLLPLGTYLRFWGWFYGVLTILIAAFKSEVNFRPSGTESAPLAVSDEGQIVMHMHQHRQDQGSRCRQHALRSTPCIPHYIFSASNHVKIAIPSCTAAEVYGTSDAGKAE